MTFVTRTVDAVRNYVGSLTWAPLVSVSRRTVLGLLQRIEEGELAVEERDGTVTRCGGGGSLSQCSGLQARLYVQREAFWVRLLLFADMVRSAPR